MTANGVQTPVRGESTVKDFLEVVFRRKWSIISIVAIATAVVVFLNLREPAVYESNGKLLVKRGEAIGIFGQQVRTLTWEEEIASQIEMIKSELLIQRAREIIGQFLPEGYQTDERISTGRVGSGVVTTSNVLWVTYLSSDPIFCRAAVDAVINAYREYYQRVRTPPEMEDFFSEELDRSSEAVNFWRERKSRLETEWGIVDIEHQQRSILDRLDRYTIDLQKATTDVLEAQEVIRQLESFRNLSIEEQAALANGFFRLGMKETIIEEYSRKLIDLRLQEAQYEVDYTDQHRDLRKIRQQIEDLYTNLDKEIESLLKVKRAELDILQVRQRELQGLVSDLEKEKDLYPARSIELERIDNALAREEERYGEISDRHMEAKVTMASNPEWTVTILSNASPAYRKKTRDYVRIALGPLFSLVVALGFAFFIDNLDHSIKNVSEAEDVFGMHVLASFPDTER
jgi:polysaccharide biosynthesis protein PslE